jgi:hypothetical protein
MTSDALLGGTGGTVWVLLLAGEAQRLADRPAETASPAPSARPPAPKPATVEPAAVELAVEKPT